MIGSTRPICEGERERMIDHESKIEEWLVFEATEGFPF
jgi:hypothetical protein